MHDPTNIVIPIGGGSIIGLLLAWVKIYADVQQLKADRDDLEKRAANDRTKLEEACKTAAEHGIRLALLEAVVTDLKAVPGKLDALRDLIRSKP